MGSLPPSSSTTGSRRDAVVSAILFPVGTLPVKTSLSMGRFDQRRSRNAIAHDHLKNFPGHARLVQQRRQFNRRKRGKLRGLHDHRISCDQRGQTLRGRNRKRIIPGRDDSDQPVGLANQAAGLGLHGQIAVGNRLVPQQAVGVVDQEARGVEHHQHFREQRLDIGFAGLAGDQLRDFGFSSGAAGSGSHAGSQFACARRGRPMLVAPLALGQPRL